MNGFIEVHYNENPILINIDNIAGVEAGRYSGCHRGCTISFNRSIMCRNLPLDYITPYESYDAVKRMIEEAMK